MSTAAAWCRRDGRRVLGRGGGAGAVADGRGRRHSLL